MLRSISAGLIVFFSLFVFNAEAQKISTEKRDAFIKSFIHVVETHDQDGVIAHLHPEYRKEQHKKFLKNNETQLVNELFSGEVVGSEEFTTFLLTEIKKLEVESITESSQMDFELYDLTFLVTAKDRKAICSLQVKSYKKFFKKKYGIVGAYG